MCGWLGRNSPTDGGELLVPGGSQQNATQRGTLRYMPRRAAHEPAAPSEFDDGRWQRWSRFHSVEFSAYTSVCWEAVPAVCSVASVCCSWELNLNSREATHFDVLKTPVCERCKCIIENWFLSGILDCLWPQWVVDCISSFYSLETIFVFFRFVFGHVYFFKSFNSLYFVSVAK